MRRAFERALARASHPRDRGSFTIFGAIVSVALLLGVGLVYDGGGALRAQRSANRLAAEAARTAGQAVDPSRASGGLVGVDRSAARQAAVRFLASEDLSDVKVSFRGDRIEVVVTEVYPTVFLGAIGYSSITVTGRAEAVLVTGP